MAIYRQLVGGLSCPWKAMLFEQGETCPCNVNDLPSPGNIHRDQAAIRGIFPHRQLWARRAPCLHCLLVGSVLFPEPLKKIKNEAFYDRISHRRGQCYCVLITGSKSEMAMLRQSTHQNDLPYGPTH
jgi:hypothetical protein